MFGFIQFGAVSVNIPSVLVANGIGVCLMSAILFNSHKRARMAFVDGRLFYWMCRICFALCILETAGFLLDGRRFPGAEVLLVLSNSAVFFLAPVLACLWLFYMNYKLFESPERLRKMLPATIPAALGSLLAVINCFTDVYFKLSDANIYYRTPLFTVFSTVVYLYLTAGAVLAWKHRRLTGKYIYMPALSFLLPIYIGSVVQLFCYGIAVIWVAVAVGLIFLYINLQSEETFLDSVTGLYNRNFLIHYMNQLKKGKTVTGVLLDVNDFKMINDTCGHLEGDRVLRDLGRMLLETTDKSAVVARYGGDEFVILLEDAGLDALEKVKASLEDRLRRYNEADSFPVPISLSGGTAELSSDKAEAFFREMDRNMYLEKRAFYHKKKESICRKDAEGEAGDSREEGNEE